MTVVMRAAIDVYMAVDVYMGSDAYIVIDRTNDACTIGICSSGNYTVNTKSTPGRAQHVF